MKKLIYMLLFSTFVSLTAMGKSVFQIQASRNLPNKIEVRWLRSTLFGEGKTYSYLVERKSIKNGWKILGKTSLSCYNDISDNLQKGWNYEYRVTVIVDGKNTNISNIDTGFLCCSVALNKSKDSTLLQSIWVTLKCDADYQYRPDKDKIKIEFGKEIAESTDSLIIAKLKKDSFTVIGSIINNINMIHDFYDEYPDDINIYRISLYKKDGTIKRYIEITSFSNKNSLTEYNFQIACLCFKKQKIDDRINEIIIYNLSGEVLKNEKIKNNKIIEADISNLPKGFYMLSINQGGHKPYTKWVIID